MAHKPAFFDRRSAADQLANIGRVLFYLALTSLSVMRPSIGIGGLWVVPTDVIAAAAGVCWLGAVVLDRVWLRWDRFFLLLLAYFMVMIASAVFGAGPLTGYAPKLASEAYLLGLPVMAVGLLTTEHQLRAATRAWLVGSALVALLMAGSLVVALASPRSTFLPLVQHHLGSLPLGPFVRYRLAFINPNMLGAYLSASIMLTLMASYKKWIRSTTAIWLLGGLSMALIGTFSAGIGGAILGGAIWYALLCKPGRPALVGAALAIGISVAVAFVLAQALTPVLYPAPLFAMSVPGTDLTLLPASRLQVWIDTWRTFTVNPLTGVGIGNPVAHVLFTEPSGQRVLLTDGHNVVLNLAAGCGFAGAMAICAIIVAVWHQARRSRIDCRNAAAVASGIAVLDVLGFQGIGGGFEDSRFVWAMLGLMLVAVRAQAGSVQGSEEPSSAA